MERKRSVRRRRRRNSGRTMAQRCKDYLRNFVAFMFSNVGIIGLVVGYTVAGAFVFIAIEGSAPKEASVEIANLRNDTALRLWQLTEDFNSFHLTAEEWRQTVHQEVADYQAKVVEAVRAGFDGTDGPDFSNQWTFAGAFLYSLTVSTTIGYGNVSPRTPWGKIATIVYAIIGMPLFLLYLSNIGDVLARSFKWTYARCCLCRWCPTVARRRAQRQRIREAALDPDGEQWEMYRLENGKLPDELETDATESEGVTTEFDEDEFDSQSVTVPVTICLTIMVGYIVGGAILFSEWEDWDMLDGSYFCFISLSTIGFGDIVPGDKIYSGEGLELSFVFCSMYLMLGMALIAMCFNLMQEEVVHKIRTTADTCRRMLGWTTRRS